MTGLPYGKFLQKYSQANAAAICGILVILGWLCLNLNWISFALLILPAAYAIGGYESTKQGLITLWQEKELDVDLLMIVAALGAACLGLWRQEYYLIIDGAVLILIFAISGALESIAMQRTERNIRSLMALTPNNARKIDNGQEKKVPISQLQLGDIVLVKPGEIIPADGIIVEGQSTLNQAPITGESFPVDKAIEDEVFAGTINGNGVLRVEIDRPPGNNLIQRVIKLVQQAQTEAPPSQLFIERFERGYAKLIVIVGISLAILPPLVLNWDWETTIYRALIFLVVASPCALMASIMPTLLSGIANGARNGILFKTGATLELMGKVRAIAFDKTGTLTLGKLQVVEIVTVTGICKTEVLRIAAAVESYSEHPIGEAIFLQAKKQKLQLPPVTNIKATSGRGINGQIEGKSVVVGKASYVCDSQINSPVFMTTSARQLQEKGYTVVWVVFDGELLGIIAIADTLRPKAAETITRLKQLGIEETILLTGDNQSTANSVATQLGIKKVSVYAELLPEDKVRVLKKLQREYQTVAMVGDGINDAPALAQATVGIAMGAAGSDVAMETADLVLMADRLEKLEGAIRLGRRSLRIIKQNIVFAIAFIVLLLIANFSGHITMPLGVIGHEGSTVIVTLSGLRLLRS